MSTMKHALGMLCAGVLAFGLVFTAHALTLPAFGPGGAGGSGQEHTTNPLSRELIGRWKAPEPANQEAYVEFYADGTWQASDGCNKAASTWEVGPQGAFDGGVETPTTLIACYNALIPRALRGATRVEVAAGPSLLLFDDIGLTFVLERSAQ
ncbi:hypothetical protein JOF28_002358 [Leucobacter exalbidus]|uniref:META domain-containing protein n=1 Tax=Leucobacter exalbidus TaxID=662960 RepID=A0A940PXX9_9MICO|nr:hypothetical protein [Leucobacter exalbidus]MBP1327126.1 hypothetical protein [Leucobacter exalbidus]